MSLYRPCSLVFDCTLIKKKCEIAQKVDFTLINYAQGSCRYYLCRQKFGTNMHRMTMISSRPSIISKDKSILAGAVKNA